MPGGLEASELVSQFMHSVRSGDFTTLRKIFSEPSAAVLLSRVMTGPLTEDTRTTLGALLDSIGGLAKAGRAQDAAILLDSISAEHKIAVLTTERCAASYLADCGLAVDIVRILEGLDVHQRVEVMSAYDAVGGLLRNGQAPAVLRLLEGMDADHKTQVLATSSVVEEFARKKHGGALMKMMRELNWAQQGEILSQHGAIKALRKYGQRRQVNAMLDGIKVAQEPFLSAPAVLH